MNEEETFQWWLQSCGVVRENGSFDIEQAKLELSDYHSFLDDVSRVYGHVTRGRISKPNTHAFEADE